ncbi:hypothetical protein SAMN05421504_101763 [Amycolatopsis xylanica]|uniref:N-acetyltransferase domain-containing protein n=1 Tax=Amycolatopsis xylanica TaxID=589385 RepID=A0A1H2U2R8_9PSEU|nr:hypothetical protein [Amycolatopsis xylanica]SDW50297.1 hypothetical protein SAMN05421504_101763 [Amycolatopsis xylanica]
MITLKAVGADPSRAHALFTEPDFYFRTHIPDLLSDKEVRALVTEDALLCEQDGVVVGLIWLAALVEAGYPAHYALHARFTRRCAVADAAGAITEAVRALRACRPVRRVTHEVCEADRRGVELAEELGFALEGSIPGMVTLVDGRRAVRFYAKLFEECHDA